MRNYYPKFIERKWQRFWQRKKLFQAKDFSRKPKYYLMIEFPYPSGDGLHVGHVRSYTALDAIARKRRMEGYNVLYPIGWDAFGLPTENYAIKTGIHPSKITRENIKIFTRQLKSLGLSFDWSRQVNTTDPKYYKWTQWIFLKFFEKGLAYRARIPINWCPSCKIGLANEEVIQGHCERCGAKTERREIKQWMLKITAYADRLLKDLEKVDYLEKIKNQQINWIGRSEGTKIKFLIANSRYSVEVFTTRADTLFGATALVIAPEHELISKLKSSILNFDEVKRYIQQAKSKSELERTDLSKEKTGIELKGCKAVNPINGEKIPIWIADYVIATYGGGAVMMVPAHDKRDYQFAKKYKLPIREVVAGGDIKKEAYTEYGILVNSGLFTGLSSKEAIKKITQWLKERHLGGPAVQFKLRDWIFSRQHYWGEPIPIIYCRNCWERFHQKKSNKRRRLKLERDYTIIDDVEYMIVPVPSKDLPVKLPYVRRYQPTRTGESPLANIRQWVRVKCPRCGQWAKRETDTMPNWAGSSWYFLRYTDPHNDKFLASKSKLKYWLPVDWYNGGMEHTTLHLLYSRFWYKFLHDLGIVPTLEPYARRTSHGIVLASDNRKMSKSLGNVVKPDEIVKQYGADTLRLYELFMGPFDQSISWNSESLEGCYRFLKRIWSLVNNPKKIGQPNSEIIHKLHQLIKKVSQDLEETKFNTAIAAFMEFINFWSEEGQCLSKKEIGIFLRLLSPLTPHFCEELYHQIGLIEANKSIFEENWPKYNPKLVKGSSFQLIIQVNGKVRDQIEVPVNIDEEKAKELALKREKIKKRIKNKKIKKTIFVPNRLINIVVYGNN